VILHLGVIDVPYSSAGKDGEAGAQTTGDVAGFLERRYHIMQSFYTRNERPIGAMLAASYSRAARDLMAGAPPGRDPFAQGGEAIKESFADFLDKNGTGIVTAAAAAGRTSRRKGKRGPPRPSFIDTGLYQASFKAWIE
jgi:hypothetical protein